MTQRTLFYTICITLILISEVAVAQDTPVYPKQIITGVYHGETPPLRDIPPMTEAEWAQQVAKAEAKVQRIRKHQRLYENLENAQPTGPDPVWQQGTKQIKTQATILQNFQGLTSPYYPSDANGTVGPNHYMQTINVSYAIYNKSGSLLAGPTAMNTLFSGVAGANYNDGDPLVLYDDQMDRWLAVEFSISGSNDYMLIAVSTTGDPTGTWYKYSFDVDDMPDYEKFGIWRDGYYMGVNNGTTGRKDVYVFQRDVMLTGGANPLMIGFDNPWRPNSGFHCIMPVDNDGPYAPLGSPGLFITINDNAWQAGTSDQLWIYELAANWVTPASSTFLRTQQINVAAFDSYFGANWNDITQPGTTQKLDAVPQVLMNIPQYRNFGTYQTIVATHSVDVDNTARGGIRWYELRKNSGETNWVIRQQGTYAPDASSRWMGSIMLNGHNEIGLGYSISGNVFPGIRFTGQSAAEYSNASGMMDVAEGTIQNGVTFQTTYNRWGDYAGMQVDPTDDKTFWFTTQYTGSGGSRSTKIASFRIISGPAITATPALLSGLDYVFGTGPSNAKSFVVSGILLTEQILISSPGNYEISLLSGSNYSASIALTPIGGTVSATTIYVRLKAGLGPGNYNQNIILSSAGAENKVIECKGSVITTPSNHVANFNALPLSSSTIRVLWTDADATGYLIKGSTISFSDISNPTNGVPESDGGLVKNIQSGVGNHTFAGLTANTPYFFKIFPYNGSGTLIRYKTDGTVPQASATTPQVSQNYLINFDDENKWTAGSSSLTSYASNHSYIDGLFSSTGGPALRQTTASQDGVAGAFGTYAWRLQNLTTTDWRITIASGGVSSFNLKIRRWDNSPSPDFNLEYSTNGGAGWTMVAAINNTTLDNSSNWKTFSGTINSANSNILIRLKANGTTERIMVDDFGWEAYSSQPVVASPTFNPPSGNYSSPVNVSISTTTEGASIYFSTGSSSGPWTLYSTAIPVTVNTFLWAYATKTGMNNSDVSSAAYVISSSCPPPLNLSASNVTHNAANVSWDAGGNETQWNFEIGEAGFQQGTGTMFSGLTFNTELLTGLLPETSYHFYVQAVCSQTLLSSWAGPAAFTTATAPPLPYANVILRPQQIDLSEPAAQSAVLLQVGNYESNDARYRLINGGNQYHCWDGTQFVNSSDYLLSPRVPGTPSSSSTFWILFTRGSNNTPSATYIDRLGPDYSANYQSVVLPEASAIINPFTIEMNLPFSGKYSLGTKYAILGFLDEAGRNLITATSSEISTGNFRLKAETGTTIRRIEVRNLFNELMDQLTGVWPTQCQDASISNFPTSADNACAGSSYSINFSQVNIQNAATASWLVTPANAGTITANVFMLNPSFTGGLVTISLTAFATPPCLDASAQVSFVVNPLPTFTCPSYGAQCVGDQPIVFSGPGITTQGGTTVFGFNPIAQGVFSFTYSLTQNGCTASCTFEIVVNPRISPVCPGSLQVYINDPPFALSGAVPAGGSYSGNGVNAGVFSPAAAGIGQHLITYTFNNGACGLTDCQFSITVNQVPISCQNASISNFPTSADNACAGSVYSINFSQVSIQNAATTSWLVTPANAGTITANVFMLNPSFTGGLVTITLTAVATPPCLDATAQVSFVVNPIIVPSCPGNIQVYITDPPFALSGALPAGGSYSGIGVNAGVFGPAAAGIGQHLITYTFNNGACGLTDCQFSITVNQVPISCQNASISNFPTSADNACAGSAYSINFSQVNVQNAATTSWLVTPANAGTITANVFMLNPSFTGGLVTITLTAFATPPCLDATAQVSFVVNPLPTFTCPSYGPYQVGDPVVIFTEEGVFRFLGSVLTSFNPQTAGVFAFTYTKTVNGCSSECGFEIVVNLPLGLSGDANGDGFVNVLDVITVINYILGETPLIFVFRNADVNGDQTINILDVIHIINIIMLGR